MRSFGGEAWRGRTLSVVDWREGIRWRGERVFVLEVEVKTEKAS